MELREYLFKNQLQQKKMAKDLDISLTHFRALLYKQSYPSRKLAKKIEVYTDGQVTKEELLFCE